MEFLKGLGTWWICIGGLCGTGVVFLIMAIWGGLNSTHSNYTDFTSADNYYQIDTSKEYHGE